MYAVYDTTTSGTDCGAEYKILAAFAHLKCHQNFRIGTYIVKIFIEDYNIVIDDECENVRADKSKCIKHTLAQINPPMSGSYISYDRNASFLDICKVVSKTNKVIETKLKATLLQNYQTISHLTHKLNISKLSATTPYPFDT